MTAAAELAAVRAIVQRWLDSTERDLPCYRALRELAVALRLERNEAAARASSARAASARRRRRARGARA